jgi:hypothetical protein|tara:strand:- start:3462 stop:3839 length:378 start_codon:yes stop_codon:yes gene_type:complete
MNPFEYANDLMVKESYDVDIEQRKDYKVFLINRSLSYQPDLIYIINEMNRYPDVEKKLHYDFLHSIIPKKKRPRKFWIKGKKLENLALVKEFFKYSNSKAETVLSVLTDGDIEYIKNKMNKGGMS